MIYPESIYNKYEIEEKDICGEKHYALVRVYTIFGFKFRKYIKVYEYTEGTGWISYYENGNTWHNNKQTIQHAIYRDNRDVEWEFKEKMTK